MPSALSYPGVYIEEVPSGVRTITGVATSIAVFIGRAARGPVNHPTTITSFADFERRFGGLWRDSTMSYALRDFFVNGGQRAIVIRVVATTGTAAATATLPDIGAAATLLQLRAASAGAWGNRLRVRVETVSGSSTVYNLIVRDTGGGSEERYLNVSIDPNAARTAARVLANSNLVALVTAPTALPPPHAAAAPGVDPLGDSAAAGSFSAAASGADGDVPADADYTGTSTTATAGLELLDGIDLFNLLCIPPPSRGGDTANAIYQAALPICVRKRAMLIVDAPGSFTEASESAGTTALSALGLSGNAARNAALYFPRVMQADPLADGFIDSFVPCGIVAGVMARTDVERGVWKAPAGLDATLNGVAGLTANLTDAENGLLNPLGINCLRSFPVHGRVIWGARTLRGADQAADEYKYVPVRRLALFIEETLYRGTQWVVFEPNDEPLWAQIRLNLGAFMNGLFRRGAFQGASPREAYFVKCDKETTTQADIDNGIVNIVVGFAPLKPAEFVVIKLQQIAGQLST